MTERNPERTKERILDAARREFGEKGLAGARVDEIARRAGVNKRMLYHYFGDKERLWEAILERKMGERGDLLAEAPRRLAESLPFWQRVVADDAEWIRLFQWEALDRGEGPVPAEEARTRWLREAVAVTARLQREGLLPTGLDPAHLHLALFSIVAFPVAFPQAARMITGIGPSDSRFLRTRERFLSRLGEALAPAGAVPAPRAKPRQGSKPKAKPAPVANAKLPSTPKPRTPRSSRGKTRA